MRVVVQVTGHPLSIGGARYNIGERLFLDPAKEQHREIIDSGWVIRLDAEAIPTVAAAPAAPDAHKMVTQPSAAKVGMKRKGSK